MNYKKRRLMIEIVVATVVLAFILSVSIPRFIHVQIKGKLDRLMVDLDKVVCAAAAYKTDCGVFPGPSYSVNYLQAMDFLHERGYLEEVPSFHYIPGIEEQLTEASAYFVSSREFYFRLYWPYATDNNIAVNRAAPIIRDPTATAVSIWYLPTNLIREDFYAPSNGLTSSGCVYLDCFGNHSPLEDEETRLGITESASHHARMYFSQ